MKLQFTVPFDVHPEQPLELAAYALNPRGGVIASAPISEGAFTLDVDASRAADLRIAIAPVRPDLGEEAPTKGQLARLRAYEPVMRLNREDKIQRLDSIPADLLQYWYLCSCRVRGKVIKPVGAGATVIDYPVCHARVHICEVDLFELVLERLPDPLLYKLRDEYLIVRERPGPVPEPDPLGPIKRRIQTDHLASAAVTHDRAIEPAPLAASAARTSASSSALASMSAIMLRSELKASVELLRPYLCRWDWIWPWFASCDPLATVTTDENGRFDIKIWHACDDQPDLYFWVEYFINGAWTTVYAPGIGCGTHWNYDCSGEVTLRITDPRVPYCGGHDSLEGKNVVVKAIGNAVSISEILRASAGSREGLVPGAVFAGSDSPFAGTLELRADFGESLIGAGITKYMWSYRHLPPNPADPVTDSWHVMTQTVSRHYRATDSGGNPVDLPLALGPDANGRIDVWNPVASATPLNNHNWPMADEHVDAATGYFVPADLPANVSDDPLAGRYEFKLELFKGAAGALVNWTAEGIGLFEASVPAPFGSAAMTTVSSPNEHRILSGGQTMGFRTVVHIDNSHCQAAINEVTVGALASGPCGFIDYPAGASAHVSFLARHANEFGRFTFGMFKGSSGAVGPGSAAGRVGDSPVDGFVRNAASVFAKDVPITGANSLVDSPSPCPDGRAALAETLIVEATATNGYGAAHWLDASAVPQAFALTPAGPAHPHPHP